MTTLFQSSDQTFSLPCGFIQTFHETWGVEKLQTARKPLSTVNEFKIPQRSGVVVFKRIQVSSHERDIILMSTHHILSSCLSGQFWNRLMQKYHIFAQCSSCFDLFLHVRLWSWTLSRSIWPLGEPADAKSSLMYNWSFSIQVWNSDPFCYHPRVKHEKVGLCRLSDVFWCVMSYKHEEGPVITRSYHHPW